MAMGCPPGEKGECPLQLHAGDLMGDWEDDFLRGGCCPCLGCLLGDREVWQRRSTGAAWAKDGTRGREKDDLKGRPGDLLNTGMRCTSGDDLDLLMPPGSALLKGR